MGLILVDNIQRITEFENEKTSHIIVELYLINRQDLENKGKQIDRENYSSRCFGIEFSYNHKENKLYVLDEGLFYLDNYGDKHFLECDKYNMFNIKNSTMFEFNKFMKNKEEYLKKTNMTYDLI